MGHATSSPGTSSRSEEIERSVGRPLSTTIISSFAWCTCSGKLDAPGGNSKSDAPSASAPAWRPTRARRHVNGALYCSASKSGSKTLGMRTLVFITAGAHRPLPRGPHGLERDVVLASQRGRMLGAMAEAVARKTYAGTTVADVVAGAGVSRKTFYEHFSDKEECFLSAFDAGVDMLLEAITRAQPPADDSTWLGLMRVRVR